MEALDLSFPEDLRLKHKKLFEQLFAAGKRQLKFPALLIWELTKLPTDEVIQVGFSVPKKHYKTAVQRNRIKRWHREAFRHESHALRKALKEQNKSMALLFITLKTDNISYEGIRTKMVLHLQQLEREISPC